jgi:hypothetical protein
VTAPHEISPPVHSLRVTRASEIQPRPTFWLWEQRIPLGQLVLLAGREGIGKSTCAYQLGADLTRGALPGSYRGSPRSIVVAATEDSWAHTIVPRLMAAGADRSRVLRVDVERIDGESLSLSLPRDVPALAALCQQEDVALILLDPLISRLSERLDTNKDAEVRQALEPLTRMAEGCRASVLGLIHENKSGGGDPLNSVMGSRAFTAVARAVLYVVRDPADDAIRLLGTPKNNLGRTDLPTLRFTIEGAKVADTDEGPVWSSRIVWAGEDSRSIAEVLDDSRQTEDARSGTAEATDWLHDYLTINGGEAASKDAKEAGKKAGHPEHQVKRAATRLKVVTRNTGFPRTTVWSLPGTAHIQSGNVPERVPSTVLTVPTAAAEPLWEQSEQWEQSGDWSVDAPTATA